jgi:hypothetical protein
MWRYYEEFGQTGGTTSLVYVDSVKGDDANAGTHLLPKKTMQGGFDLISTTNAVMVVSGFFKENSFLSVPSGVKIIAEGYVLIDFNNNPSGITNTVSINNLDNAITITTAIVNPLDYGLIHLKNFTSIGSPNNLGWAYYNCFFDNCTGFSNSTAGRHFFLKCLIKNGMTFSSLSGHYFINSTLIGTQVSLLTSSQGVMRNCVVASGTKLVIGAIFSADLSHNAILGTGTDRIVRASVSYNDIEALKTAGFAAASNLASSTDAKFNLINPEDLTLQHDSPLIGAGVAGVTIGYYDVAKGQGASDVNWTLANIDNTTNSGEAVLTGASVGTLTATSGIQIAPDGKRKEITRVLLPASLIDPEFGETINSQLGSSAGIPSMYSIEIQYSQNGGSSYNGTWLKVPYGAMPLHDKVNNCGNADANFVSGAKIKCTHILPRITLRDND